MTTSLVGVGSAVLRVIGLNPQRITTRSESRVPGHPTWEGMDYQATGLGEKATAIEAVTYPLVIGGLDALAWLQRHHEAQDQVNYIRLQSRFLGAVQGSVVIRNLFVDENHLHPFTGVGRKVGVELDLVHVGDRP